MQVRPRLKAIASFVERGATVVDIGCDHALLDIYLTLYNGNQCLACDINQNALMQAKQNIERYHLQERIVFYLSDGLNSVPIEEKATLIISGMGTATIEHIMESSKLQFFDTIIVQSNNELMVLRKRLVQKGYSIKEEKVVEDRGIYYVVMKWEKGPAVYKKKELFLGPYLRKHPSQTRNLYYQHLLTTTEEVLKKLPKKYWLQRIKKKQWIKILKKELNRSL